MARETFNKKKVLFLRKLDLNLKKKLVRRYIWSTALYNTSEGRSEISGKFAMWCWRKMERISWTELVGNEEVLQGVKEKRKIVQIIKRRKNNWISHILRRKCLLKCVIEGNIESLITGAEGRKRRYKQPLDDLTG